jgi:hypothetical protein
MDPVAVPEQGHARLSGPEGRLGRADGGEYQRGEQGRGRDRGKAASPVPFLIEHTGILTIVSVVEMFLKIHLRLSINGA